MAATTVSILVAVVIVLAILAAKILGRSKIKSRTTTRSFGPFKASVRGVANVRSLYVRLPFGYRWVLFERAPEPRKRSKP